MYEKLRAALKQKAEEENLFEQTIHISCKALTPQQAIGTPEHEDYPIIKGKEVMVEAEFLGAKGHAFADEFENREYRVDELLTMGFDTNAKRASFISGLNAIFRSLGLSDKTVHCKDQEPVECAKNLIPALGRHQKILLVGLQPRFLETLSENRQVRVVDLDSDNVGRTRFNVKVEPPENTEDAIQWCDLIFATGSTLVNGTLKNFLDTGKPVIFYGVTISAAAKILNLNTYCFCGR